MGVRQRVNCSVVAIAPPVALHPATRAEQVDAWRARHEITVFGTDIPKPVTTFEESPFPDYVLAEIRKAGMLLVGRSRA